ncbi:MAG: eCIS core domain-containing protein [Nannocystaceae bacterium]
MGREHTREAKKDTKDSTQRPSQREHEVEPEHRRGPLDSRQSMMLQMFGQGGDGGEGITTGQLRAGARMGVSGIGQPLPYRQAIQSSFGRHNVSQIQAHIDSAARKGTDTIGAKAFASGEHVAFRSYPDLFMAAHEATHVVQQRGGVQLFGGIGRAHDPHEQHADAVAREVVAGRSAERLLDRYAPRGRPKPRQTSEKIQFWGEPDHYIMGQEAGKIVYKKLSSYKLLDDSFKLKKDETDPSQETSYEPDGKKVVESESKERFMVRGPDKGYMSYGAANRFAGDLSPRSRGKSDRGPSLEQWTEKVTETGSDYLPLSTFGELTLLGTNASHFYPLAGVEYRRNHAIAKQKMWIALELRREATSSEESKEAADIARQAIVLEGFASHFLADCFAAGHLSPHALGRIGEGIGRSGPLVNTWHDLLNALPDGVPTTLGRFHGDYSMDGHDLKYLSNVISNSLLEIAMPWYTGNPYNPSIILPKPDVA